MVCHGFLFRQACIGVLVGGVGALLSMKYSVVSFCMSMCLVTLGCLYFHCWRISMVCLALELVGSWVDLGFSVGMDAFV